MNIICCVYGKQRMCKHATVVQFIYENVRCFEWLIRSAACVCVRSSHTSVHYVVYCIESTKQSNNVCVCVCACVSHTFDFWFLVCTVMRGEFGRGECSFKSDSDCEHMHFGIFLLLIHWTSTNFSLNLYDKYSVHFYHFNWYEKSDGSFHRNCLMEFVYFMLYFVNRDFV